MWNSWWNEKTTVSGQTLNDSLFKRDGLWRAGSGRSVNLGSVRHWCEGWWPSKNKYLLLYYQMEKYKIHNIDSIKKRVYVIDRNDYTFCRKFFIFFYFLVVMTLLFARSLLTRRRAIIAERMRSYSDVIVFLGSRVVRYCPLVTCQIMDKYGWIYYKFRGRKLQIYSCIGNSARQYKIFY